MIRKIVVAVLLLGSMAGCTSVGPAPAEMILGQWQGSVGGFPLTITYDESTVRLGGSAPVAYQLEGDRLTYAAGGQQVRIVSFPEPSIMQQLDPVTGTEHLFSRVTP